MGAIVLCFQLNANFPNWTPGGDSIPL